MLSFLTRCWELFRTEWLRIPLPPPMLEESAQPVGDVNPLYQPLERITLSDEVSRTLFTEYAEHRAGQRGQEETGWILMGRRKANEAIVLATLPAGALREAGIAHVLFNAEAQAIASVILRQMDRKLNILGIVHTHPGTLRHPSKGDYQGDRQWVNVLRAREGVFAIGTADGIEEANDSSVASQPEPHVQVFQGLRFTWYALGQSDKQYRPLPVQLTLGPDLALPLHEVWAALEVHAARLEKLWKQLARLRFEIRPLGKELVLQLCLTIDALNEMRVLLQPHQVTYTLVRNGEVLVSGLQEPAVDRGVYLLLAEMAKEKTR